MKTLVEIVPSGTLPDSHWPLPPKSPSARFVKLRYGIMEHMERGSLGLLDLAVFVLINLGANLETGVWIGSAEKIRAQAPRGAKISTIQHSLQRLQAIGFIRCWHKRQGSRGNYVVHINKFDPPFGELTGKRLNAEKSIDSSHPFYEPRTDREAAANCRRAEGEPKGFKDLQRKNRERPEKTNPTHEGKGFRSIPSRKSQKVETGTDEAFRKFWEEYPARDGVRAGKEKAIRAWREIQPDEVGPIMNAVERLKQTGQWQKENGKYIPMASRFLTEKRWLDEVESPRPCREEHEVPCPEEVDRYEAYFTGDLDASELEAGEKEKAERWYRSLGKAERRGINNRRVLRAFETEEEI